MFITNSLIQIIVCLHALAKCPSKQTIFPIPELRSGSYNYFFSLPKDSIFFSLKILPIVQMQQMATKFATNLTGEFHQKSIKSQNWLITLNHIIEQACISIKITIRWFHKLSQSSSLSDDGDRMNPLTILFRRTHSIIYLQVINYIISPLYTD